MKAAAGDGRAPDGWRRRRRGETGGQQPMISAVFVDRPRLAIVIAFVITIAGALALLQIPVAQFPDIVPPQVTVPGVFPGASAEVVESQRRPAAGGAGGRRRPRALYEVDQRQ